MFQGLRPGAEVAMCQRPNPNGFGTDIAKSLSLLHRSPIHGSLIGNYLSKFLGRNPDTRAHRIYPRIDKGSFSARIRITIRLAPSTRKPLSHLIPPVSREGERFVVSSRLCGRQVHGCAVRYYSELQTFAGVVASQVLDRGGSCRYRSEGYPDTHHAPFK